MDMPTHMSHMQCPVPHIPRPSGLPRPSVQRGMQRTRTCRRSRSGTRSGMRWSVRRRSRFFFSGKQVGLFFRAQTLPVCGSPQLRCGSKNNKKMRMVTSRRDISAATEFFPSLGVSLLCAPEAQNAQVFCGWHAKGPDNEGSESSRTISVFTRFRAPQLFRTYLFLSRTKVDFKKPCD